MFYAGRLRDPEGKQPLKLKNFMAEKGKATLKARDLNISAK